MATLKNTEREMLVRAGKDILRPLMKDIVINSDNPVDCIEMFNILLGLMKDCLFEESTKLGHPLDCKIFVLDKRAETICRKVSELISDELSKVKVEDRSNVGLSTEGKPFKTLQDIRNENDPNLN